MSSIERDDVAWTTIRQRWTCLCKRHAWVALIGLGLTVSGVRSASAQTAELSGRVQDESSAGIPSAVLQLVSRDTSLTHESRTDAQGLYRFIGLRPGAYALRVEAPGFRVTVLEPVRLEVEQKAALNIRLQLSGYAETVSVNAGGLTLGSRDGSVATVVDRRFAENVPLSGRTFQALLELAPGVIATTSGGFAVSGQRADANYFQVDGVSAGVAVPLTGDFSQTGVGRGVAATATGGFNGIASLETLQEFRVQTSSFAPEYGRGPGAQVSIVTRSGSNVFTGATFEQVRDARLAANDWFANARQIDKPNVRQHAFGGVLGGPISSGRVFFFGSYEGLLLNQPRTLIDAVPTQAFRESAPLALKPLLSAFPLPTSAVGTPLMQEYALGVVERTTSHAYSARLDSVSTPYGQLFVRYSEAPSEARSVALTTLSPSAYSLRSVTSGWNGQIRRLYFDARLNYTRNIVQIDFEPIVRPGAQALPPSFLPPGFDLSRNSVNYIVDSPYLALGHVAATSQSQANAVVSASALLGAHHLKIGVDYRRLQPRVETQDASVLVVFSPVESVFDAIVPLLQITRFQPTDATFQNLSIFAQDAWQLSRQTSLTFGVRWDLDPAPSYSQQTAPLALTNYGDPERLDFAPRGTALWKTRTGNFAPRLGVSHALNASGTTLLGGVGLFFDPGAQGGGAVLKSTLFPNYQDTVLFDVPFPFSVPEGTPSTGTSPTPPYSGFITSVEPDIKTPLTWQWNARAEQQIGDSQSVWVGYVGARARRLASFVQLVRPNPNFPGTVSVAADEARSTYHSFQAQYRRRSASGLSVLGSYTYSRTFDNGSFSTAVVEPDGTGPSDSGWGPADFDIRHNVTSAISYEIDRRHVPAFLRFLDKTSADILVRLRSAAPLTVTTGNSLIVGGQRQGQRPDVVAGQPFYLDDRSAPGHRRLNPAAFAVPAAGRQGTLGRNALRGFGASQVDLGIRRAFAIARTRLQLRLDAFNVFNIPNFATYSTRLRDPRFGLSGSMLNGELSSSSGGLISQYQWGGPRVVELGARLSF